MRILLIVSLALILSFTSTAHAGLGQGGILITALQHQAGDVYTESQVNKRK